MKFLFDLLPVILFFSAFKYSEAHRDNALAWLTGLGMQDIGPDQAPILLATAVVIIATLGQILWVHLRHGKVDKMLWMSLGLVVFFGGLTLFFHDERFIKWKPTLLYWLFAGSMLVSTYLFGKNGIRSMLNQQLQLPEPVWAKLNLAWIGFFTLMGGLNLFVAFNYPTDIWVNFKLFGGMGLMLVFVLLQGMFLSKYLEEKE